MRIVCSILLGLLVVPAMAADEHGMINHRSDFDVEETADRLEKALRDKGINVFARIDHAEGAADVGLSLRPTELVIFGNPKVGTPLMHCVQSHGIDLPQKALIWRDHEDRVWLTYNDPAYIAERHDLDGAACQANVEKVAKALDRFARAATER